MTCEVAFVALRIIAVAMLLVIGFLAGWLYRGMND